MNSPFAGDFSDFEGYIYLNAAYHGAMPRQASDAAIDALKLKQAPHRISDPMHFEFPDRYRDEVAALLGVEARDVAIADSATHGIMTVVNGLEWSAGDEVVLPAGEFPANRFPWLSLESRGVKVHELELDDPANAVDRLAEAITPRTRVVAAAWVSFSTGLRIDIAQLGRICRERGVLLVVDGSQGVGGLPLDPKAAGISVLATAGYKWLLGPYGLGFTWIDPELSPRLQCANVNWQSLVGATDFSRLSECKLEFREGACRFDVNQPAAFINLAAGTASLAYLNALTPTRIHEYVQSLLARLVQGLPEHFRPAVQPGSPSSSNILCIVGRDEAITERSMAALKEAKIVVSRREYSLRISPHLYNGTEDIDRLLEVLHAVGGL